MRTGERVVRSLKALGAEVHLLEPQKNFVEELKRIRAEFVFLATHGADGEDGTLQGIIDLLAIPYTGSNRAASGLCFNKVRFKELLSSATLPTPPWFSFTVNAFQKYGASETLGIVGKVLGFPIVVKPVRGGSSMGIGVAKTGAQLESCVLAALNYDDEVLLERFVDGRELAVTVLSQDSRVEVLPIVEIEVDAPIYTFDAHYEIGSAMMEEAALNRETLYRVKETAAKAFCSAGCSDCARVDIILDAQGQPNVLELNTIPGLTETGPTPYAAGLAGYSFDQLVSVIASRAAGGYRYHVK